MPKSIIVEGKTTSEAISNGLKKLNVSRDRVEIKVLEEHEKRSFFSILAPRVVKVELTLKENGETTNKDYVHNHEKTYTEKPIIHVSEEELKAGKEHIDQFLSEFFKNFENIEYFTDIDMENSFIRVNINGNDAKTFIGYRGEVLNSLQNVLNAVSNKYSDKKLRIILNVSDYRQKREKSLEELADKVAKTVFKTGKSITLEPMMAYERKIIHNRLQKNAKVITHSVEEEPYRKVVIEKR